MDLAPYKLDIDDLIREFDEADFKTLADMKRVWLSRKFSYIFEDIKLRDLAVVMQSMYSQSMGHMVSTNPLSRRLGGLFCLYCLYETQPFKPEFKVYLSLDRIKKLKNLVVDAKKGGIGVVSAIVRRMMEKNAFLFGFLDINEYSGTEKVKEVIDVQNARIKKMHEMLLGNANIERFLQMDMGVELEVKAMKDICSEYDNAKELAIKEAGNVLDMGNVKHIAENRTSVGENIETIAEKWDHQKQMFYKETGLRPGEPITQTGLMQLPAAKQHLEDEDENPQPAEFLPLFIPHEPSGDENGEEDLEYAEDLERQLAML
ncbi:hypothetical protein Dimus_023488 [Dionaea muscipula]